MSPLHLETLLAKQHHQFDIEAFVGKKEKNYLTLRKSTKVEVYEMDEK